MKTVTHTQQKKKKNSHITAQNKEIYMYLTYMWNSKHDDPGENDLNKRFLWIWFLGSVSTTISQSC